MYRKEGREVRTIPFSEAIQKNICKKRGEYFIIQLFSVPLQADYYQLYKKFSSEDFALVMCPTRQRTKTFLNY